MQTRFKEPSSRSLSLSLIRGRGEGKGTKGEARGRRTPDLVLGPHGERDDQAGEVVVHRAQPVGHVHARDDVVPLGKGEEGRPGLAAPLLPRRQHPFGLLRLLLQLVGEQLAELLLLRARQPEVAHGAAEPRRVELARALLVGLAERDQQRLLRHEPLRRRGDDDDGGGEEGAAPRA